MPARVDTGWRPIPVETHGSRVRVWEQTGERSDWGRPPAAWFAVSPGGLHAATLHYEGRALCPGDFEPGEPEKLTLVLPGLDFFAFESANSFFWWNAKSNAFERTWMSD